MKSSERFSFVASSLAPAAAVLLVAFTGCQGPASRDDTGDFVWYELEGFPYPPEFKFDKGYKFQPKGLQVRFKPTWIGEYSGSGLPADHVPFFLREMQARGWKLSEIVENELAGKKRLEFIKGDEGTTIVLSRVYNSGSLYGSSSCTMRAEVRTLGLEHFSIEENHALSQERAENAGATSGIAERSFESSEAGLGHTESDGHDHGAGSQATSGDADTSQSHVIPTAGSPTAGRLADGSLVESIPPAATQDFREE